MQSASRGPERSWLARLVPALAWLRVYQRGWLHADVIAGATLAAYLVPAAIGDASLAGLPPQAGLYACLFPALVFWLFCSSRHTAVSVTSAISLLIGASLGELAGGDPARFAALASCTALLTALVALAAWMVKAGSIVNFVSEPVMVGFKAGVALYLTATQLPKLFGIVGSHGDFWDRMRYLLGHLRETNFSALALGLAALAVLVLGKLVLKDKPVALFVVLGSIVAASWLGLDARGVRVLGEVPQGLPPLGFPAVRASDLNELLPLALACFLLATVETAAIGRMFAARDGIRFDSNQEFLALAVANAGAGLGKGFPVSGGMSQSLVNESAGARTPLSGFFSGIAILLVTLFLSGALRELPQPVLAAIVLVAVGGLFKVSALRRLYQHHRRDFTVAMVALLGVLGSGLLRGVLLGAVLSLLQLLRLAARPHVAVLGRIPGTRKFSDADRHPDNELVPGVLIVRPEGSVVYFNADNVCDQIRARVSAEATPPRAVLCDLSESPYCDPQGVLALATLASDLARSGIRMQVVEAHGCVRDMIRMEGFAEQLGGIRRALTLAEAVEVLASYRSAVPEEAPLLCR